MHAPEALQELVIIFAAAVVVALVLQRLRLPAVAGLLVAGALIGPDGFGLVGEAERIAVLAEIGVVLLLFTIGLELTLGELRRLAGVMARLGLPQVVVTLVAVAGIAVLAGIPGRTAVFLGFLVALSSTAIVLQSLSDRDQTDSPHGRATIGVLLLQDLAVVPMMLVLPALAARQGGAWTDLLWALLKAAVLVAAALVVARVVMPRLLELVAGTRRRDLFVLTVLLVCAGIAWAASRGGLSLALGAFLGGVVLADSEYGHQALADLLPLRDTFASVFFISIGMLLDTSVLLAEGWRMAGLVLAVVVGKAAIVMACAALAGFPRRTGILAGLALAHVGEFSFVLAQQGTQLGLFVPAAQQAFLAASVLTMLLAPVAIRVGPAAAAWAVRHAGAPPEDGAGLEAEAEPFAEHVLVVGYGLGGQLLAEALRAAGTRYAILDIDADRVRRARARGEPARFGDATSPAILERMGAATARHVVLVLNDPDATLRAVHAVRGLNPDTPVTVRSRYLADVPQLERAGASDVVAQEVEASLEIIARVLRVASVPRNVIEEIVRGAREGGGSHRRFTLPRRALGEVPQLTDLKIESFLVHETAWVAGHDLASAGLRSRTGATVIAIGRGAETAVHPEPGYEIAPCDVLYLSGEGEQLAAARQLLEKGPGDPPKVK